MSTRINRTPINKPANFNEMISLAETLSSDFPFVRVDLYQLNNNIIFGELTFTPSAATPRIDLVFDTWLGQWLDIQKLGDLHNSEFFSDTKFQS